MPSLAAAPEPAPRAARSPRAASAATPRDVEIIDVDEHAATAAANGLRAGPLAEMSRGSPQLPPDQRLVVPADDQCLYHCIAAAYNVEYYKARTLEARIDAAYFVKGQFLNFLLQKAKTTTVSVIVAHPATRQTRTSI